MLHTRHATHGRNLTFWEATPSINDLTGIFASINNNSDSWLIMLMQQDLEGHELLH